MNIHFMWYFDDLIQFYFKWSYHCKFSLQQKYLNSQNSLVS